MLRSVIVGARRSLLLAGCTALFAALYTGVPSYAAQDTRVDVSVCSGTSSNASLVVSSPVNGSTVSSLPIAITGIIDNITQIDVSIDGQYNSTIPVSTNQTTFSASLQLAEGTHTISLVGNDVCAFLNPTATLVITYYSITSPVPGPTVQPPAPIVPSNQSNTSTASGQPIDFSGLAKVPVIGGLAPIATGLVRALDFDATARQGGIMTAMARFALFVAGIGLLFFGAAVVRLLLKRSLRDTAVKGYIKGSSLQDPRLSAHFHRNIALVRCTGALFLCLSFVI